MEMQNRLAPHPCVVETIRRDISGVRGPSSTQAPQPTVPVPAR